MIPPIVLRIGDYELHGRVVNCTATYVALQDSPVVKLIGFEVSRG
jgi:hypothetical protein